MRNYGTLDIWSNPSQISRHFHPKSLRKKSIDPGCLREIWIPRHLHPFSTIFYQDRPIHYSTPLSVERNITWKEAIYFSGKTSTYIAWFTFAREISKRYGVAISCHLVHKVIPEYEVHPILKTDEKFRWLSLTGKTLVQYIIRDNFLIFPSQKYPLFPFRPWRWRHHGLAVLFC